MSIPLKLGVFVLGLALLFGFGMLVGTAVGPL
jgi:hypothetical protein